MMKTIHFFKPTKIIALLFLCSVMAISCSDDDPQPVNEQETITRVILVFTAPGGIEDTYTYNVGETIPTIVMEEGLTYDVSITFEDASDPADVEDITAEVEATADDHYIFYDVNDASFTLENSDTDVQDTGGTPIGLHTVWTPTGTDSGTVTVYLIHEPTSKTGTVRDDFGGEDDVQVTFDVNIIP